MGTCFKRGYVARYPDFEDRLAMEMAKAEADEKKAIDLIEDLMVAKSA